LVNHYRRYAPNARRNVGTAGGPRGPLGFIHFITQHLTGEGVEIALAQRKAEAALRAALEAFTPDPTKVPTAANSKQGPLAELRLKALDAYAAIARQALAVPGPRA
jgi:hypothetical protein